MLKRQLSALTSMAKLVGASSVNQKGHWFDSQSRHIPGLQVQSLVGARARGSQSVFLSDILTSMFLPPTQSPPSPLSENL